MSVNNDQSSNGDLDIKHQIAINFFEYQLCNDNNLANGIDIINFLKDNGFDDSDIRLKKLYKLLKINDYEYKTNINLDEFIQIVIDSEQSILLNKIFSKNLIVPDFKTFCTGIIDIFNNVKKITNEGHVADYIPQLAKVDPNLFGISICTIDGQRFKYGDCDKYFCIQSGVKPLLYGLALEDHGSEKLLNYIGCEPSGVNFNNLSLNKNNLPHNPMINSGAIMSCSLLYQDKLSYERFETITDKLTELSGNFPWKFSNSVYLSEKDTADSNFCLAYMMRKYNSFPTNTNIQNTLELYFQTCSLEVNCDLLSIVGATIANNGVNVLTKKNIFKKENCKNILSLMLSCGMYDYSGKWAFDIGLPAKSGVSGCIYAIIPDFGCISVFSPLLDDIGNSVKGIQFFKQLIEKYQFHIFDSLSSDNINNKKINPRLIKSDHNRELTLKLLFAVSEGDISELKRLISVGGSENTKDYDNRSLLHIAASEGYNNIIKYLLKFSNVEIDITDRWGNTPLDDAKKYNHIEIIDLLTNYVNNKY
jgi:glutaminase